MLKRKHQPSNMKNLLKHALLALALAFASCENHGETKIISVAYINGTNELLHIYHSCYYDGSFTEVKLSDGGCLMSQGGSQSIRCGVRSFTYVKY